MKHFWHNAALFRASAAAKIILRAAAGNMLIVKPQERGSRGSASGGRERLDGNSSELRPIDHGFCLPEALEPPYFEWLHWPQVQSCLLLCSSDESAPAGCQLVCFGAATEAAAQQPVHFEIKASKMVLRHTCLFLCRR